MSVPQNVTDALTALQGDADDVAAKSTANDTAQAALVAAQQTAAAAAADLATAQSHEATDLAAFVVLVQQVYGPPSS